MSQCRRILRPDRKRGRPCSEGWRAWVPGEPSTLSIALTTCVEKRSKQTARTQSWRGTPGPVSWLRLHARPELVRAYTLKHTHTAHESPHANAVHRENVRQIQKMLELRDTEAKRSRERQPVYTIRPAKEEFKRESMRKVMEARERQMTELNDIQSFYHRKAELLDLHTGQKVKRSHMHRCMQSAIGLMFTSLLRNPARIWALNFVL